jgi:hypothetical protein
MKRPQKRRRLPVRVPSTDEFQKLFADIADNKEFQGEINALFKSACKSDRAKATAAGLLQTLMSSVTLGGVNPGPSLAVMMMGFRLGCTYSESGNSHSEPEIPTDAMENYLKFLERPDTDESKGE